MKYPWRKDLTTQEKSERAEQYMLRTIADFHLQLLEPDAVVDIMMRAPAPGTIALILERGLTPEEQFKIDTDPAWDRAFCRFVKRFEISNL